MVNLCAKANKFVNNKGFSLVELIIVIAIMVALIAVMGPQYVKYIQKSRDASMLRAAQDVYDYVKTEYADQVLTGSGDIRVEPDADGHIQIIVGEGIEYEGKTGDAASATLEVNCGLNESRQVQSKLKYIIHVNVNGNNSSISKEDVSLEEAPGNGG